MSRYIYKGANHNAYSNVLARIVAVQSAGDRTAKARDNNTMNEAAYVVVGKWRTIRAFDNVEACSTC